MSERTFFSDNDTETMADALKAIGLAETLRSWLERLEGRDSGPIRIEDKGSHHVITIPSALDEDAIGQTSDRFVAGRGGILVSKKEVKVSEDIPRFDYEGKKERRKRYFEQRNNLSDADKKFFTAHPEAFPELADLRPDPDLDIYRYVDRLGAADAYNALLGQWYGESLPMFRTNLRLLLTIFGQHPNAIVIAQDQWGALVKQGATEQRGSKTLLQLLNPVSGKGSNTPKANGLHTRNLEGFWLLEYLKFVGLFTVSASRRVTGAKDYKTYLLRPTSAELGVLHSVMTHFRDRLIATTAIRLDILAALRFTRVFVEYRRDTQQDDPLLSMFGKSPRVTDLARGFDIAFYKHMGSAYATMNLATINLPNWAPAINSVADADHFLALLKEHEQVISTIQTPKKGEGSEEIELMRQYRDFLSSHDAALFFQFAARYGDYYLGKRYRDLYARQFTTYGIEQMEKLMANTLGNKKYSPILQNEGFRAIAQAIRSATVTAQYYAAQKSSGYPYEVRYGLGQQLLRSAPYPQTFLKELSEFVHSYNTEAARVQDRIDKGALQSRWPKHWPIATSSIEAIAALVDEYQDSELICKMLVAYGYARDARTPSPPDAAGTASEDELEDELEVEQSE